ncbi:MAG: TRAP transporter small permease [Proteobacteria bacterium]|nr:TRAP transporter small permease [Pseudomonadota bacterium]
MSEPNSIPVEQRNVIINSLARVNRIVGNAARNVAAGLLVVMVIVVLLQVCFRYVLNNSLTWSEELAKVMMVWSAFLVAPWAYRMGAFVAIEMFADALPRRLRLLLLLVIHLLVLWVVAVFFRESLGFWSRGLSNQAATMAVSMAWFYSVVPFSFAALFTVSCELILRDLMTLIYPDRDYTMAHPALPMAGE